MSTLFMLQTFLPSRRRDCLPLHRILLPSQPLQKDNTPSLRTKLASPKVNFCCSVKPSQLWWGLLPISTINEIFRTIPRFAPPHLPPLPKGGGLTARHKLSLCCVSLAIHPPFLFTKLFAVKTEGLPHHYPLAPHQPFQNRTIPRKLPPPLPLNERSVCFASLPRQPLVPLHRTPPFPQLQ